MKLVIFGKTKWISCCIYYFLLQVQTCFLFILFFTIIKNLLVQSKNLVLVPDFWNISVWVDPLQFLRFVSMKIQNKSTPRALILYWLHDLFQPYQTNPLFRQILGYSICNFFSEIEKRMQNAKIFARSSPVSKGSHFLSLR